MLYDASLLFAGSLNVNGSMSGQLVTALGNTISTNVIDNGPLSSGQVVDLGRGEDLQISLMVVNQPTSGGAATVAFQLVQADDAAITSNVQVIVSTDAVPIASLLTGNRVKIQLPRAGAYTPKRYMAVRYVVAGAVLTNVSGQFFGGIVKTELDQRITAGGFSIQ